jgi:Flp pilus assembly protein TadD
MLRTLRLLAVLVCGVFGGAVPASAEWNICNEYREPQKAIAACTRMISAGTFQPMFHVYGARGVAHSWSGSYDLAIRDFDECLRLEPKDSICFGQRGIAYKLKGNRAQALADLQTAVTLDPKNETAVSELNKLRSGK